MMKPQILYGQLGLPILITAAAFSSSRNIKVSHSVFRAILKEYVLYYISFFRSNTVENILLSSFLSGNKSWDNLIFLRLSSIE